jgi:hypothetical protein
VPNTPDLPTVDAGPAQDDALLPVSPFLSTRYHFGMLLGVDDFDVAAAHPRGKLRLHDAWLHGAGVVWGFGVVAAKASATGALNGEVEVLPGLALDRVGHELHLDQPACVDVGAWYAEQKQALDDATLGGAAVLADDGGVTAQLRVELRFRACLTRQVPALREPCDGGPGGGGGGGDTAYSRTFETVELKLVPGLSAPVEDRDPPRSPRLRLLFGVLGPRDPAHVEPWEQEVLDAREAIASQEDLLRAIRRFAAQDGIAAAPGTAASGRRLLFPGGEDAPVVLADLRDVKLALEGGRHRMTAVEIHPEVRPSLVATSTIQELLQRAAQVAGGPTAEASRDPDDAKVFRLRSLALPFHPATLGIESISITALRDDGWVDLDLASVELDAGDGGGRTALVTLAEAPPEGVLLRLVARGTGPTPVLWVAEDGARVPFRGDRGRGGARDGSDFVEMWEVT